MWFSLYLQITKLLTLLKSRKPNSKTQLTYDLTLEGGKKVIFHCQIQWNPGEKTLLPVGSRLPGTNCISIAYHLT